MFMKKLLTILCICIASICLSTTRAVEQPNLFNVPGGRLYYAMDGDKFYFASLEEIGSDAQITIYNDDLSIKEQFTVKGVISYEIMENGYQNYKSRVGATWFNIDINPTSDIIATRGLFTKDSSWVITVRNDDDHNSTRTILYSSEGKKLCELPKLDYHEQGFICLSGLTARTPYYCIHGEDSGTITIYTFEDVNGVVTPKAVASNVKAYPNPLPSGTPLQIDLNREADNNTILTITDLDGRQVCRERVRPGLASVRVSPKFSRGLHIYTVIYSDGESFSGKVAAE